MSSEPVSVFISFSGNDDPAWRQTFQKQLNRLLKPAPGSIYYSEQDPLAGGDLGAQLKVKLRKSTFLISIIGDNYLHSAWCQFELKNYFDGVDKTRSARFLAIFLNRDTWNAVDSWSVWKDAGLTKNVKFSVFYQGGRGEIIRPVLEAEQGKSITNPEFTKSVEALVRYLIEKTKESGLNDNPRLAGSTTATVSRAVGRTVAIGAATTLLEDSTNRLEMLLREKLVGFRILRLSLDQIEKDDADESNITNSLREASLFIVPLSGEEPRLTVLGTGGHIGYQKSRWEEALKTRLADAPNYLLYWRPPVSVVGERPASGRHAKFFEELRVLEGEPEKIADSIKDRLDPDVGKNIPPNEFAKIVIESNSTEYISPEPLQARIKELWTSIQSEMPAGRRIKLLTSAVSVKRMRELKTELGADAVVLLWGTKDGQAVYAQVDNVDRDCLPPQKFIAYLTPPKPEEVEDDYLGWQVMPFRVRDRQDVSSNETVQVVEEFEAYRDRMIKFLRNVANSKA